MNFSSFKYFAFNTKQTWGRFSFNKNTLKMMSSSTNRANLRFVSLFSNKVHLIDRISTLNNITKRGVAGTAGVVTGNGINLYNNPEITSLISLSNSLAQDSVLGCGFNLTSNVLNMAMFNDYLMISEGK